MKTFDFDRIISIYYLEDKLATESLLSLAWYVIFDCIIVQWQINNELID